MPGSFSEREPEDDGVTQDQLCGCCGAPPGHSHDDDCTNAPMSEDAIEAMIESMARSDAFFGAQAQLNAVAYDHPDVQALTDLVDAAWLALTDEEREIAQKDGHNAQ